MAKISVIVPAYNVEQYLSRCVDSILNQSFSDFKLILVDDGSPDRCGEICDTYAQSDTRVAVIHQKNGGLSAARNAGLDYVFAHSNSEWLTFIDSDDWVHPAYLQALYDAAQQNGTEISVCEYVEVYDETATEPATEISAKRVSPETLFTKQRGTAVVAPAKLYKKSLFQGIRFPLGKLHEDEFVTYKLLFCCKELALLPSALYYYFQNPEGIILRQDWDPRRADAADAMWEQCKYFEMNGYKNAEISSARELLKTLLMHLEHIEDYKNTDASRITRLRSLLRKVLKNYDIESELGYYGYTRLCGRLAHPVRTALQKKWRHILLFFRRSSHG